jgi:hypothetical protein
MTLTIETELKDIFTKIDIWLECTKIKELN